MMFNNAAVANFLYPKHRMSEIYTLTEIIIFSQEKRSYKNELS